MPHDFHSYDPLVGHGLPHDPFKAIVAPRPIGWISTVNLLGQVNLAPYSFFNAINDNPPMLAFSSVGRKDSLRNIEATGEFVYNLATRSLAEAMNLTSKPFAHGQNEMEFARLESLPATKVKPPRVAASPAAMECKVLSIQPLKDLAGNVTSNTLVIGQVVAIHIRRRFLKDGLFDMIQAGTIARCGYVADYAEVTQLFEMFRPT